MSFQTVYSYYAKMCHYRNSAEIPLILVGTQGRSNLPHPNQNPRQVKPSTSQSEPKVGQTTLILVGTQGRSNPPRPSQNPRQVKSSHPSRNLIGQIPLILVGTHGDQILLILVGTWQVKSPSSKSEPKECQLFNRSVSQMFQVIDMSAKKSLQ